MIDEIIMKDLDEIEDRISPISDYFSDKTYLVTGGAGFLGSWLCDTLIRIGSNVICQDNFSSGFRPNIDHVLNKTKFTLFESDIRKKGPDIKIDGIFHMASRASPEDYNQHQVETLLTNSEGTNAVLELARKNQCCCLYASTSEIYGDPKIVPTPESYWGNTNCLGERSCYDEGKRFGESLCFAYNKEFGTNVKMVRIFNTYGPRIRPDGPYGRAVSRFILKAINNEDITIFGDGNQTRSFCYVSDTIIAILLFFTKESPLEVINIGSENEISINELANKIVKKTNSNSKIIHKKEMPDDPRRRRPDISKAKKLLNWQPIISLDKGLDKTINWFSTNKNFYS